MKQKKIYALGFFDGVHLGHQALLSACRRLAAENHCLPAAVTFDLPPSAVLQNLQPNMLTTVQDRKLLLHQYGMEEVRLFSANAQTLSMSWQAFLEQLIQLGAAGFVCGEDYRFGSNGEGSAQMLCTFCKEGNIPCIIVPEQTMDGQKISSTRIRALLETGDVENANRLLGHPHIFTGTVVSGRHLGRTIGIPTANLHLPECLLTPAFGVYACTAMVDEHAYKAVTNIGTRPTVGGNHVTVEPWLLDFSGDLYGKELSLQFHKFLRPERKFANLEELKAKIQEDATETYKLLK